MTKAIASLRSTAGAATLGTIMAVCSIDAAMAEPPRWEVAASFGAIALAAFVLLPDRARRQTRKPKPKPKIHTTEQAEQQDTP